MDLCLGSADTDVPNKTHPHVTPESLKISFFQEAQLMLTNPRDAFRGQSRSPNIVPFHVRYSSSCAIVTLSLSVYDIRLQKMLWPWNPGQSHSRSLKVVPFYRLGVVSYKCSIENLSAKCTVFEIFKIKMPWSWKPGCGSVKVIGHVTCHRSIERIWLPIDVL